MTSNVSVFCFCFVFVRGGGGVHIASIEKTCRNKVQIAGEVECHLILAFNNTMKND